MPRLTIRVTVTSDGAGGLELSKGLDIRGEVEAVRDNRASIRDAVGGMATSLVDLALEDFTQTPQPQQPKPEDVAAALLGAAEPAAGEGASPPAPPKRRTSRGRR